MHEKNETPFFLQAHVNRVKLRGRGGGGDEVYLEVGYFICLSDPHTWTLFDVQMYDHSDMP